MGELLEAFQAAGQERTYHGAPGDGASRKRSAAAVARLSKKQEVAARLMSAIPDAEFVYLRIGRPGSRRQINDDDLKDVALKVRDRSGWVVFSNPTGAADARRLLDML